MAINLKLSSSPNGIRNVTFNPVVVAAETNVFGMDPSDTTNYLVPGNGQPAVSTSGYYNMYGLYNFRPYDLDSMGSEGAAVKSAQGGRRYVWVTSPDHNGYAWTGGMGFLVGFSHQPWDFPKQLNEVIIRSNQFNTASYTISGGFNTYEFPRIIYNPDDADGLPFYLLAETGPEHFTGLWRSSDFVTFTVKEISHYHTPGNGKWASFIRYAARTGTNAFTTIALAGNPVRTSIWTTTDGINYSTSETAILGMEGNADSGGSVFTLGGNFTVGSQLYGIGREDSNDGGLNQYATIWPMDSTTFDKQSSPAKVRVASGGWSESGFPGPTFLQEVPGYYEDGILYALPTYGFPSDVNTTAQGQGRGGTYYADGGGLDHQFIDRLVIRVDDTAARQAAPVGMGISCSSGTATITWKDALPQNTYRLYRGTTAATQATLIGDYTGVTSATDSPSTGRYWYKLVTLDSGVERNSRVLSVYVSSSAAFVNEHIDRLADNGGDISSVNRSAMDRLNAMLDTVGIRSTLELFTHAAFGTNSTGAPGGFLKVYDLGTTRLPRSEDFKATTSATTYDATGVNGGPCWVNANNNSYSYWGNPKRGNTIQQKRQITILVAYERTQTAEDFTFVGTGPVFGTSFTGNAIIALKHTAGTPGNIEFSLSDETSTKTASVAASGSGMQIAVGTYDGTDMLAYTGSTAGSAVSTLDPNPNFGQHTSVGVEGYVNGSLCGSRVYVNSGSSEPTLSSPFPRIYPILGSGSVQNYLLRRYTVADSMNFTETNAKGKIQCVMVLEGAINSTQIADIITELQSTADW